MALDLIAESQLTKYLVANELFLAGAPGTLFGRRGMVCTALNWYYYGGPMLIDGVLTIIADNASPLVLTASSTNYIEATRTGTVSANTSGFTAGRVPLYTATTNTTSVTAYIDYRTWAKVGSLMGLGSIALTDANTTLTAAQARNEVLEFTGTLTAQRDITVPLAAQRWTVYNGTNQALQIIGATGTGVVIATTKTATVYSNGTNVRRATADV